jgi:hypothetical protein
MKKIDSIKLELIEELKKEIIHYVGAKAAESARELEQQMRQSGNYSFMKEGVDGKFFLAVIVEPKESDAHVRKI